MPDISSIVNTIVIDAPSGLTQQGFGYGLIVTTQKYTAARVNEYANLDAVGEVYPTDDPVYDMAAAYFGQSPAPKKIFVGGRTVDVVDLTVGAVANLKVYTVIINGTSFSITADADDTAEDVEGKLTTAINAGDEPVTASSGGSGILRLTADVAGVPYSLATTGTTGTLVYTLTETNADIATDLAAIKLANSNWYVGMLTDRDPAVMADAAVWFETQRKALWVASQEADIVDEDEPTDTDTLAAVLHDAGYDRTGVIYHEEADTIFPDAALVGRVLPYKPGEYTARHKELTGIAASALDDTQYANALSKDANVIVTIGGLDVLQKGRMASGIPFDRIHGRDKLVTRIEERVFALIATLPKVPYTLSGLTAVENAIRGAADESVSDGFLSGYQITLPVLADVSTANRTNRILPDITIVCQEAGAIEEVDPIRVVLQV